MHIVLLDETGPNANQGGRPGYGGGQAGRTPKKAGKKIQFTIVSENGSLVIQKIVPRDH